MLISDALNTRLNITFLWKTGKRLHFDIKYPRGWVSGYARLWIATQNKRATHVRARETRVTPGCNTRSGTMTPTTSFSCQNKNEISGEN